LTPSPRPSDPSNKEEGLPEDTTVLNVPLPESKDAEDAKVEEKEPQMEEEEQRTRRKSSILNPKAKVRVQMSYFKLHAYSVTCRSFTSTRRTL